MISDQVKKWIKTWEDPWKPPIVIMHEDFYIVRDDLIQYGTKIRGLDFLIGHDPRYMDIDKWVFGCCPAQGYAQISLPIVCKKYGKEAHLFMAARNHENLHPFQLRGIELGTQYHWIPDGMLNVTKARAREYAAEDPKHRMELPLGLEHPTVIASFIKVARELGIVPDHFWTVGSSGTLNRSLQEAWPDAAAHVVQVGHNMQPNEIGRAIHHKSLYKFNQRPKKHDLPPFPSAPEYDAKGWSVMKEYYKTHEKPSKVLFWNVGA